MDDVVEQDGPERRRPPRWLRGTALLAALGLGAVVVTRTGALSAGAPEAGASPPATSPTLRVTDGPPGAGVVVRAGDHLERYDAAGRRRLATLPSELPALTPIVHLPGLDGRGPLVSVNHTVLFRVSPTTGRTVTSVGRAERVVAASGTPNGVYVLQRMAGSARGVRMAQVNARTGAVVDDEPFPGFADGAGWRPVDVMTVGVGLSALLLTRPAPGGRDELVLAWDRHSVRFRVEPRQRRIGVTGGVLGTTDGRIVANPRPGSCRGEACRLTVVTVTRDRTSTRTVEPPPGWVFGAGFAVGDRGDPVVGVARAGRPGTLALARLVAGGRRALLVPGSEGVVAGVAPIGGPDGSVVFAVTRTGGVRAGRQVRLATWRPDEPRSAMLLDLPPLTVGARPVCVCR